MKPHLILGHLMQLVRNQELVTYERLFGQVFECGFFGFLCVERLIIYDQPVLE